jgi:uncharacterized protein YuzE
MSGISIMTDPTVDAAYIGLSQNEIAHTVEFSETVLVDVDEFGVAVGIELLGQNAEIPFTALVDRFHVHSSVVETLRLIRPSVGAFVSTQSANEGTSVASGSQRPAFA